MLCWLPLPPHAPHAVPRLAEPCGTFDADWATIDLSSQAEKMRQILCSIRVPSCLDYMTCSCLRVCKKKRAVAPKQLWFESAESHMGLIESSHKECLLRRTNYCCATLKLRNRFKKTNIYYFFSCMFLCMSYTKLSHPHTCDSAKWGRGRFSKCFQRVSPRWAKFSAGLSDTLPEDAGSHSTGFPPPSLSSFPAPVFTLSLRCYGNVKGEETRPSVPSGLIQFSKLEATLSWSHHLIRRFL